MKRAVAFFFLLACSGLLLGGPPEPRDRGREPAPLLQELVRLTRAGSSKETVLAYARAHRLELPPEVSDADLLWLRESGVSETVVEYMKAIDVRASDEGAREDVARGSRVAAARPRAAYSRADSYDANSPDNSPDNSYDSYGNTYDDGYPVGYSDGYDPFYASGYYPYPVYFFVDRDGFVRRFHGRDHRFGRHHGFRGGQVFGGHRRGAFGHRGFERPRVPGFRGRRADVVVGPRRSGRPAFARGGFPAGSGRPRGVMIARGGFGNRGFPGAGHSGGGFSRGRTGFSGGTPGGVGAPGGRGRH